MDAHFTEEEAESEKERAKAFLSFLIQMYANPSGSEDKQWQQQRKQFIEELNPMNDKRQQLNGPAKIYEWDEELLKRIKAQQKGG